MLLEVARRQCICGLTSVMTVPQVLMEIPGSLSTVKVRRDALDRLGMSHGSGSCAFFHRGVCGIRSAASRARGLCDNKYAKHEKSEDRDQHKIPAPRSCDCPGCRGRQTPQVTDRNCFCAF